MSTAKKNPREEEEFCFSSSNTNEADKPILSAAFFLANRHSCYSRLLVVVVAVVVATEVVKGDATPASQQMIKAS